MAKKIDILIIGNGFDIFHGLPTRYTDFLEFIKQWDKFYNWYNNNLSKNHKSNFNALSIRLNNGSISLESVYDFATYATIYNKESIKFFNDHYDSNFWINYLTDNLNDNGGWIDFEKEIENTLSIIETYFLIYYQNVMAILQILFRVETDNLFME